MNNLRALAATASIAAAAVGALAAPTPAHAATDNTTTAYNFFVAKGLSPAQAAGITGNFMQESGTSINPAQYQKPSGPGRGIAQWSVGQRWDTSTGDNMVAFASQHGWDRWSLQPQLEFTWYELTTHSWYGLASLRQQTTVDAATRVFSKNFEGCNPTYCANNTRVSYATQVYTRNTGKAPAGGGQVTTSLPVLRQGSTGAAVRTLQTLLGINADGIFGPATGTAVTTYQRTHALTADGVVGGNTWNALLPVIREGATGATVKALQGELNAAGAHLSVDGDFGPGTTAAVKTYQGSHQLTVDGVVGDNTWTSLITH